MSAICADCGMDTTPSKRGRHNTGHWEWYMVRNRLWKAAGMKDGFLCIGCLELRIARVLTPTDFADVPINQPHPWDTPRLASRNSAVHMRSTKRCSQS